MKLPFKTKEDIEYYFKGDKIQCLICGKWFKALNGHFKAHGLNVDQYKEMFGLPWSRGLCGCKTADKFRDNAETLRSKGHLLTGFVSDEHEKKCHRKGPIRTNPSHSKDRSEFFKKLGGKNKYESLDFYECWRLFNSGMTQAKIGKKFGMSQSAVGRFMNKGNIGQRKEAK